MSIQSIKDNSQGMIAKIIVGLIVMTFALFGVDAIVGGSGGNQKAAAVNGDDISEIELLRASDFFKRRMLAEMGNNADPDLIDDQLVRTRALDELVQRQLMLQVADEHGLYVADARIDQAILQNENFQTNGVFDRGIYEYTLRNLQMTPLDYKTQLTRDLLIQQTQFGFATSAFMTPTEVELLARLDRQLRDFSYLTIPAAQLADDVTVTDTEIQAFYEKNLPNYMSEESLNIEYLELRQADFAKNIDVEESEVEQQYQQEIAALEEQEERRAAHILITSEERSAGDAKALINDIRNKLNEGEDFSALAKEHSDDPGSAENGGDLGFAEKGAFVAEFEDALFALNEGEISNVVETDFGYHLIRLEEVRTPEAEPFELARERLINELRFRKAEEEFVAAAEELQNDSFSAGDLIEPAKNLNLKIQTSEFFNRNQGVGIGTHSKVRRTAFSDELLTEGNNSDLLELTKDYVVVIRVKQHNPAKPLPLEEVADSIRSTLKMNVAKQNAQKLGEQILVELRDGKTLQQASDEHGYTLQRHEGVNRITPEVDENILKQLFRMAKPAKSATTGSLITEPGDFVVLVLDKVVDDGSNTLSEQEVKMMAQFLAQQSGIQDLSEFVAGVEANADIEKF